MGSKAGIALSMAASARTLWFRGEYSDAAMLHDRIRDDAMALLKSTERAYYLNIAAGFHSSSGDSSSALQLLSQAMTSLPGDMECGVRAVLECNIAHELLEFGHCDMALACIDRALSDPSVDRQARLASTLRINRLLCLLDLGLADRAMSDVRWLIQSGAPYRRFDQYNETHAVLTLCALDAGETDVVRELFSRPAPLADFEKPDSQIYGAILRARQAESAGRPDEGLAILSATVERCERQPAAGLTPRVEQLLYRVAAERQEECGNANAALLLTKKLITLTSKRAARLVYPAISLSPDLSGHGQRKLESSVADSNIDGLSPSLRRTLNHVRQGMSNKEIARALGISRFTVRDYCSELYSSFGVKTRAELIALLGSMHQG